MSNRSESHRPGTRRDFLRVGGLTAFGLGLSQWRAGRMMAASPGPARRCILIWLDGGPSHLETFDPKPDAPAEVRGPFSPIDTSVPGVVLSELLVNTSQRMRHCAIVRSVTSPLGEHNLGAHYLLTGYKPTPVLQYPAIGSVVGYLRDQEAALPAHVAIPNFRVGGGRLKGQGFLPSSASPFAVGGDPAKADFRVQDLDFYPAIDAQRVGRRKQFLQQLDRFSRSLDQAAEIPADKQFEQAYRLITSARAKQAFDLGRESPDVRRRYGPRTIGQCCLLARRLIEGEVPFVTVNHTGWDTHDNIYTRLKEGYTGAKTPVGLIPSLDQALSALIDDLHDRRLLQETLIVVMGEFGRTPKLNTSGGRDHWPRVFSVLLAGGGVAGGQVIGSSDAIGESPHSLPITPADLACTVYTLLGIDPRKTLYTADGRPVAVSRDGNPVNQLIST